MKIVASDKTGTLTHGEFAVLNVDMVGKWKKKKEVRRKVCCGGDWGGNLNRTDSNSFVPISSQVFRCLAVMERESSHPMAAALVARAQTEGVTLTEKDQASEHEILKGEGVQGVVDGTRMYVGNARLMERLGLLKGLDASVLRKTKTWSKDGGTVGFMAVEKVGVVCVFVVSDKVRSER